MKIPVKAKKAEYLGLVMSLFEASRCASVERNDIVDWKIEKMSEREFTRLDELYGVGEGEERAANILSGLYEISKDPSVVDSYRRWRDKGGDTGV